MMDMKQTFMEKWEYKNGITKYVHPTFLYESIAHICNIYSNNKSNIKKRKYKGEITYLYQ